MFRDRRWRSPWVHPRSGLENKDWIRLHRRPFRLQINSIKAWLPQVRPARSTCEGRRGGSNSSGAVLFDQGPATFVNEVNSSGRQWPDKTDTIVIVSYLQKNVYTEYVYSYFVYTGKKLSSWHTFYLYIRIYNIQILYKVCQLLNFLPVYTK